MNPKERTVTIQDLMQDLDTIQDLMQDFEARLSVYRQYLERVAARFAEIQAELIAK